jgi:GntR family transcriptional regulator/MocR family aminotransferase
MTSLMKDIFADFKPIGNLVCLMVKHILRGAIDQGRLLAGMALPTAAKLARHLRISKSSVERAYTHLKDEGLLQTLSGKATIIAYSLPRMAVLQPDLLTGETVHHGRQLLFDQLSPHRSDVNDLNKELTKHLLFTDRFNTTQKKLSRIAEVKTQLRININHTQCANYGEGELILFTGYRMVLFNLCYICLSSRAIIAASASSTVDAIHAFIGFGKTVSMIREDEFGMVTSDLEELCQKRKVGMVYLNSRVSHLGNRALSTDRIAHLIELSHTYKFLIVEDDQFRYFDPATPNPLIKAAYRNKNVRLIYLSPVTFVHPGVNDCTVVCGAFNDIKKLQVQLGVISDFMDNEMLYALSEVIYSGQLSNTEKVLKQEYRAKTQFATDILRQTGLWKIENAMSLDSCFIPVEPAIGTLPGNFYRKMEQHNIFLINPGSILSAEHLNRRFIISIAGYVNDNHLEADLHLLSEKALPLINSEHN